MYLKILHDIGGFTTASPCNQIPATIYAFVFFFLLPRMRRSNKTVLLLIRKTIRSDVTVKYCFLSSTHREIFTEVRQKNGTII